MSVGVFILVVLSGWALLSIVVSLVVCAAADERTRFDDERRDQWSSGEVELPRASSN